MSKPLLVIDTNVVLDLFVFRDARYAAMSDALVRRELGWIATQRMRDELQRVLAYPHLAARLQASGVATAAVMSLFDESASVVEEPAQAPVLCKDIDDQPFIDLAVQHQCILLSKDAAVLALQKRLALLGVTVAANLPVH